MRACFYPIPPDPASFPYESPQSCRSPVVSLSPESPNRFSVARPAILAVKNPQRAAECCDMWAVMYCEQYLRSELHAANCIRVPLERRLIDLHKLPREHVSDPDADGNAPPGLGHSAGLCRRWDLTTLASLSAA
jgi:hypothetical protein